MASLQEMYAEYMAIDKNLLNNNDREKIRNFLRFVKPEDLKTIADHRQYIELLAHLRESAWESIKSFGDKFRDTLKSMLKVGEDGVYSHEMRFVYELIQNVDDCTYKDINKCDLEILIERGEKDRIKKKKDINKRDIIFTYNEEGFTPENVFSITGIAEASKNISEEKYEIGEKGIGFKSVFGIADKVYIQSGMFSFSLNSSNFVIPTPEYDDGFEGIEGTRLILEVPTERARKIYEKMAKAYAKPGTIIKENPILFLNKLTHLKIYQDSFRSIEFNVSRSNPQKIGSLQFERDVEVSVRIRNGIDGNSNELIENKSFKCVRYTTFIKYGLKECLSRYPEGYFKERPHKLIALIPIESEEPISKGVLYSFLPTKVETSVPVIVHAPFKLSLSRESVDSQGVNAWFIFTVTKLSEFLKAIYVHFCQLEYGRNKIWKYVPTLRQSFFTGENAGCLTRNEFLGSAFLHEKIFYTTDGTFESCDKISSFNSEVTWNEQDTEEAYKLIGVKEKLFIPFWDANLPRPNIFNYGGITIDRPVKRLLEAGLTNPKSFAKVAKLLQNVKPETLKGLLSEILVRPFTICNEQARVISEYKNLTDGLWQYCKERIDRKVVINIEAGNDFLELDGAEKKLILDSVDSSPVSSILTKYIAGIHECGNNILTVISSNEDFFLPTDNAIILANARPYSSFAAFARPYDKNKAILVNLEIEQASANLNDSKLQTLSQDEYFDKVRAIRMMIVKALGDLYANYIRIINQASQNTDRFLNELIQNADDCEYDTNVVPSLKIFNSENGILKLECNEQGFSRDNLRAITSIGESTKNKLLNRDLTGEKGIGFKAVFEIADTVEIHSGGFDFILKSVKPTVPERCSKKENVQGTEMIFKLKKNRWKYPENIELLRICVCLKRLRRIEIGSAVISIEDSDTERSITVNNKVYRFERIINQFKVKDEKAIEERNANGSQKGRENQTITFYIPKTNVFEEYYLYSGLPTNIKTNIPLIIDAPFELTSPRENVLENAWNDSIRSAMYDAIGNLILSKREELRIDVLKFIGFKAKNNDYFFQTFSNDYLNPVQWIDTIKNIKILPDLGKKDMFLSAGRDKCVVVPEVIASLHSEESVSEYYDNANIIDTANTSRRKAYYVLLKAMGCKIAAHYTNLEVISENASQLVHSEKTRKELYSYLIDSQNELSQLSSKVASLKIFPIRVRINGEITTEYISRAEKHLFIDDKRVSDSQIKVLDTAIMTKEQALKILGVNFAIPQLTQDAKDGIYRDNIIKLIECSENNKQGVAEMLLREFESNRNSFQKCQYELKGMVDMIPLKMSNGEFKKGVKFSNIDELSFWGDVHSAMIVDSEYEKLAEYIGCPDILNASYADYEEFLSNGMSNDDLEDIQQYKFRFKYEILTGLCENKILTDAQIAKYSLEYYAGTSGKPLPPEKFPEDRVYDTRKILKKIQQDFQNPNEYRYVTQKVWEPSYAIKKAPYASYMYMSQNDNNCCFCQKCQKLGNKNYFERVEILPEPEYAWDQMFLNLCLTCAKDYKYIRKNKAMLKELVTSILECDATSAGKIRIDIPDANTSITFTSRHLADIQAILKVEKDTDRISERKRIKKEEKEKKK